MDVQAIRVLINQAKECEAQEGYLHQFISRKVDQLHHAIAIPGNNTCDALFSFVLRYIEQVPDFVEALRQASNEANVHCFIKPLLEITVKNFLSHQDEQLIGLDTLLDKAYFTHRLIEEVNDSYMAASGTTLLPIDITWDNLVVHSILGETFANKLDAIIEQVVSLAHSQAVNSSNTAAKLANERNPKQWLDIWSLCHKLAVHSGIELKFNSSA